MHDRSFAPAPPGQPLCRAADHRCNGSPLAVSSAVAVTPDPKHDNLRTTLRRIGAAAPEVIELFDYLEDTPLWIKDEHGHYQWVNVSFLLNFGVKSRAEIIGRTDYDFCGEVLSNQYRMDDERVLRGERILSRVELVGRFDHTARWCVTSKVPLRDASGAIVGTAGVTRPLQQRNPEASAGAPLSAAIRFVSERYGDRITNEDLARACGLSVRVFERQFRAAYHSSPHDYVRQLRVRMSCNVLVFSRRSLADVATEFGFADQSHFTKEFRRIMGETPKSYRDRFQQRTTGVAR
jgi:AraC-like DNA-binding protein